MKRFHVHLRTENLARARAFYSALQGQERGVIEHDYLKWMVDDPRINVAVSTHGDGSRGVDHVGIEAQSDAELEEIAKRLAKAQISTLEERDANCCYANSNKHWVNDPDGVVWETFHTHGARRTYGEDATPRVEAPLPRATKASCCGSD
ncbi:MAG: VOC family protein [Pseudomonadota bacterium]